MPGGVVVGLDVPYGLVIGELDPLLIDKFQTSDLVLSEEAAVPVYEEITADEVELSEFGDINAAVAHSGSICRHGFGDYVEVDDVGTGGYEA